MKIRHLLPTPLLVVLALAGPAVQAQDELLPLPPEKTFGSVSYVTGGVPDEQLPAFKAARSEYPLAIEVYQKSGAKSEFTADAEVTVTDRAGRPVLEARTEGPYLYAKVPPGTYRVKASLAGHTVESKDVTVGRKGTARAVLVFPEGTD